MDTPLNPEGEEKVASYLKVLREARVNGHERPRSVEAHFFVLIGAEVTEAIKRANCEGLLT